MVSELGSLLYTRPFLRGQHILLVSDRIQCQRLAPSFSWRILHTRLAPSHLTRDRDVLFIDPATLRRIGSKAGKASPGGGGHGDGAGLMMVGQNVTLSEGASTAEWCVGDEIRVGGTAMVRIRSCRKPCPKNNRVHGEGAEKRMLEEALGGVFGTVIEDGVVHVGDSLTLLRRPQPRWTCSAVHLALYGRAPQTDPTILNEIAALSSLEGPRYAEVARQRALAALAGDGGNGSDVGVSRGSSAAYDTSDDDASIPYAAVREAEEREREGLRRYAERRQRRKPPGRVRRALRKAGSALLPAAVYPPLWLFARCTGMHKGITPPA